MKKVMIFLVVIAFISNSYGQEWNIEFTKNLYVKTDSIKRLNRQFILDSNFKIELLKLEKQHPSGFFEKFFEYLEKDKYDECAFLYFLGNVRYTYFNLTNKKYEPSGDGALSCSIFQYPKLKIEISSPFGIEVTTQPLFNLSLNICKSTISQQEISPSLYTCKLVK